MRRHGKRDGNHIAIVKALRAIGVSVLDLASVGRGCPDLLVATRRGSMLMEIKDGSLPPSRRRLTDDEEAFLAEWRGPAAVVGSVREAVAALEAAGLLPSAAAP
jgi:hypothetical protein